MIEIQKSPVVSLVFSFRNEEAVLPELIRRTRAVLGKEQDKGAVSDYELLFVNEASTDRSLQILLDERQRSSNIRMINMSRCFGVAACIAAGMKHIVRGMLSLTWMRTCKTRRNASHSFWRLGGRIK